MDIENSSIREVTEDLTLTCLTQNKEDFVRHLVETLNERRERDDEILPNPYWRISEMEIRVWVNSKDQEMIDAANKLWADTDTSIMDRILDTSDLSPSRDILEPGRQKNNDSSMSLPEPVSAEIPPKEGPLCSSTDNEEEIIFVKELPPRKKLRVTSKIHTKEEEISPADPENDKEREVGMEGPSRKRQEEARRTLEDLRIATRLRNEKVKQTLKIKRMSKPDAPPKGPAVFTHNL